MNYRLLVAFKDVVWCLNGALPRPLDETLTLPDQEPCLVHTDPAIEPFSLSPLLRFRPGEGEDDVDVDFDELFFLNAGSLERLSYIGFRAAGHLDGKSLGSYDAFRALMAKIPTPPIPKDPRCDFSGMAEFHSRLFVGRGPVLDELTGAVRERTHQYVVMKALAGMGKTAIFASLLQAVRNRSLQDRADPFARGRLDRRAGQIRLSFLHAHKRTQQPNHRVALADLPDLRPL